MKKKVVMGEKRLVAVLERMIRTETDQDRTLHLQSTLKEIQGKRTEKAPSKFVVEAPAEPGNSKGMVIHRIKKIPKGDTPNNIWYNVNVLFEWKNLERVLNFGPLCM